jgi:hypothetical protein
VERTYVDDGWLLGSSIFSVILHDANAFGLSVARQVDVLVHRAGNSSQAFVGPVRAVSPRAFPC